MNNIYMYQYILYIIRSCRLLDWHTHYSNGHIARSVWSPGCLPSTRTQYPDFHMPTCLHIVNWKPNTLVGNGFSFILLVRCLAQMIWLREPIRLERVGASWTLTPLLLITVVEVQRAAVPQSYLTSMNLPSGPQ